MSSVQHLREFISARLTAAAAEIFSEVEKTIVQYEEVIDRQRGLLEISWKPQINSQTADIPDQSDYEEEAFPDEQLCNRECSSSLDHEEIKDEREDILTCQQGEQLRLKHETESVAATPTHADNELREPESNSDHVPSSSSPVHEHLEGSELYDVGAKKYAELTPKTSCEKSGNNSENSFLLETSSDPDNAAEKQYFCYTCGKSFSNLSSLERHTTVHTNEKPYSCKTCGRRFSRRDHLSVHMRTHTGEKPFSCKMCGKCFSLNSTMLRHMRTHTSEKPYSCKTCGKCFSKCSSLLCHMRTHTGNRLYSCKTCGRSFNGSSHLARHMRTHTGEKPYSCETCGKRFSQNSNVMRHMRTHR